MYCVSSRYRIFGPVRAGGSAAEPTNKIIIFREYLVYRFFFSLDFRTLRRRRQRIQRESITQRTTNTDCASGFSYTVARESEGLRI